VSGRHPSDFSAPREECPTVKPREYTMTSAIDRNDRAESVVEDYDAIRDVVQICLDGEATGDVVKRRTAFLEDARMFGSLAGERDDVPISEL
jgi:hypothetical protein